MNKTQISQVPDEELIEIGRNIAGEIFPGDEPMIMRVIGQLADRLEIRNGDVEAKRAHEQTMAEVDALRLEMANAWREWLSLPNGFPTERLLDAMSALLPAGFELDPEALRDE